MLRRHRILSSVALLVALSFVGSACSDDSADFATENPKAAMVAASKRTVSAKTVKLSLSATTSTGVKVVSGSGAYEFDADRGRFKLNAVSGVGVDMVITPDTMFVKLPQKNAEGKSWVSLTDSDLNAAAASSNANSVQLAQLLVQTRSQVDPRSTLDALGDNVPDLRKIKSQKIRGVDTTQLRGRVDLSDKAIAAAPESRRAALEAARTTFGPEGYPVDVWFDRDGRVRRVQYAVSSGEGDTKVSTTISLDLYGFGEKSGIAVPNASDVGNGAAMLNPTTTTAPK